MIFAHTPKSIFQIAVVDSFTVGSSWFFGSRFCARDTLNYAVRSSNKVSKDISVSDSLLYILGFHLLVSIVSLGVYFDLVIYSMFQCTYWRLSCIFVDYSEVISLVWTTYGFYPCIKGFCTLNKLCLLCFFLISILRSIFIGASNRFLQVFGKFIFAAYYSIIKFIIMLTCSPHHFVYLTLCIFSLSSIRFCLVSNSL